MSSPSQSLDTPNDTHEMKSGAGGRPLEELPGETIGHREEDYDLSQFGYKAELEVSMYRKLTLAPLLIFHSDVLACGR